MADEIFVTPTVQGEKKGITGTTLKIIALVAMFIDHFAAILIGDYLMKITPVSMDQQAQMQWVMQDSHARRAYAIYGIMRMIGRFGFPIFAFLIVEGFLHTRSVWKYALNLGAFALISELPFNLGFSSKLLFPGYQNVFFTLFLGLLCIAGMHYLGETKKEDERFRPLFFVAAFLAIPLAVWLVVKHCGILTLFFKPDGMTLTIILFAFGVISLIMFLIIGWKWDTAKRNTLSSLVFPVLVCCALGDLLSTDYAAAGVLTIAVMYLFREKPKKAFALGCTVLTLMSIEEAMAFFMLIPIGRYNGKRGMKINKYVFYAFYPVHIGLIYLLTLLLGFTTFLIR